MTDTITHCFIFTAKNPRITTMKGNQSITRSGAFQKMSRNILKLKNNYLGLNINLKIEFFIISKYDLDLTTFDSFCQ